MNLKDAFRALAALTVFVLCVTPAPAFAGTIYKWTDDQGKVHFGDRPPARETAEPVKLRPINTYTAPPIVETAPIDPGLANLAAGELLLFSAPWCGHCQTAKRYLREHGIAYTELDVEASADARRRFERPGGRGLPLFVHGQRRLTGFSPESFERFWSPRSN